MKNTQENDKLVAIGLQMARKAYKQGRRRDIIKKLVHWFLMFMMLLGIGGMYFGMGTESWSICISGFIIYGLSGLPYFLVKNGKK